MFRLNSECLIFHCAQCNPHDQDGDTCDECAPGYFVNGFGECQENCLLLDAKCVTCRTDKRGQCAECKDGWYVQAGTHDCVGWSDG